MSVTPHGQQLTSIIHDSKLEHLNQFTVASIKLVVLVWWLFGLHKTIKSDQMSMFISLGHLNS